MLLITYCREAGKYPKDSGLPGCYLEESTQIWVANRSIRILVRKAQPHGMQGDLNSVDSKAVPRLD